VSRFAVARRRGHAWDHARGMCEQDAWPEHAEFMDVRVESVEPWEVLLGADRFRRQEGSASPSGRSVSTP
jgi:hypothetical protein